MDRGGRIVGMLVFLLGIVILIIVFGIAYGMFFSPASRFLPTGGTDASGLGTAIAWTLVRVALLFVMTLTGSFIAARGIQLYLGSGERPKA